MCPRVSAFTEAKNVLTAYDDIDNLKNKNQV